MPEQSRPTMEHPKFYSGPKNETCLAQKFENSGREILKFLNQFFQPRNDPGGYQKILQYAAGDRKNLRFKTSVQEKFAKSEHGFTNLSFCFLH